MDWLFIVFGIIFIILVMLIVTFLVLLSKQGDERYEHIKTKAMANSFIAVVGSLMVKLCSAMFDISNRPNSTLSHLSLLVTVARIFLVSLVWQKKKYGG